MKTIYIEFEENVQVNRQMSHSIIVDDDIDPEIIKKRFIDSYPDTNYDLDTDDKTVEWESQVLGEWDIEDPTKRELLVDTIKIK